MFVDSAGTWSQQAELKASDGAGGAFFGNAVVISGTTAMAGAPYDVTSRALTGEAYVFTDSSGTWVEEAILTASDGTDSRQRLR